MKRLFFLLFIVSTCLAGAGFRSGWRGTPTGSGGTVTDTLAGPTITIVTGDTVVYLDFLFSATVEWGDGAENQVFVLAWLDQDYNISPSGYLKGEWGGETFTFEITDYANLMFRDEPDQTVNFIVYAFDMNGLFDIAEKTVVFLPE